MVFNARDVVFSTVFLSGVVDILSLATEVKGGAASQVRPFITTLNLFVAVFGIIATKSASRGAMGIYLYLRSILVLFFVILSVAEWASPFGIGNGVAVVWFALEILLTAVCMFTLKTKVLEADWAGTKLLDNPLGNGVRFISSKIGDITRVLIGAIAAIVVGLVIKNGGEAPDPEVMTWLAFPGKLWLNGLKLIVMPMIFANIVTSVASLKTLPGARKLGAMTFGYYTLTTVLAACSGLFWTSIIIIPNVKEMTVETIGGVVANAPALSSKTIMTYTMSQNVQGVFFGMVPNNIINAAATNNLLGVIVFALAVGLSISNPKTSPIVLFFKDVNEVMAKLITLLVSVTGIGVFSLVVPKFATLDLTQLIQYIGTFLGCVFTGLAFHALVVYPSIFFIACRKNPFPYMKNALPAVFTAMGTSSSAATLPVTLACAKVNGVRDSIAKFVLSLGCTVNMDGTAIGFPTAVIFMAQAQGIYMNFGELVVVVFLSAVSSMGAAPIPSAGLVLLVMIMESTRIPITEIFGLILAVDWLYDRPETMVNIFGDSLAACIIEHFTPLHEEEDTDMEKGKMVEGAEPLDATEVLLDAKKTPEVPEAPGVPV